MQKTVLDGKFVDMIGLTKLPIQDPLFKKLREAKKPIRTHEYLSYPIFDMDGELCMNLQVTSKKKKNSQFAAGFTMFDEVFLHLCGNFLQIKLH